MVIVCAVAAENVAVEDLPYGESAVTPYIELASPDTADRHSDRIKLFAAIVLLSSPFGELFHRVCRDTLIRRNKMLRLLLSSDDSKKKNANHNSDDCCP